MSERFLFMPSVGFALALSALALNQTRVPRKPMLIILGVVILAFSVKTVLRNPAWKDNLTLFTTDVKTSVNSAKALNEAGGELSTVAGKMEDGPEKTRMLQQAVEYLDRATKIHPNYKLAYLLKGNAQYYLGDNNAAIQSYRYALQVDPDYQEAMKNMGVAYREEGKYQGETVGDLLNAVAYLSQAYLYLPNDYETVHAYGVALGLNGEHEKAIEMFHKGVELAPKNATAYFNLGLAYHQLGDDVSAQKYYDKAVELDPEILNRRSRQQ